VWPTDGRTGQTDRRTDGQNYDSQDRASIAASRGKKNHIQKEIALFTNEMKLFDSHDIIRAVFYLSDSFITA